MYLEISSLLLNCVIVLCISICVFTVLNLLFLNTLSYHDYHSLGKIQVKYFHLKIVYSEILWVTVLMGYFQSRKFHSAHDVQIFIRWQCKLRQFNLEEFYFIGTVLHKKFKNKTL